MLVTSLELLKCLMTFLFYSIPNHQVDHSCTNSNDNSDKLFQKGKKICATWSSSTNNNYHVTFNSPGDYGSSSLTLNRQHSFSSGLLTLHFSEVEMKLLDLYFEAKYPQMLKSNCVSSPTLEHKDDISKSILKDSSSLFDFSDHLNNDIHQQRQQRQQRLGINHPHNTTKRITKIVDHPTTLKALADNEAIQKQRKTTILRRKAILK
ncbi:hypothetical protein FDP41_010759 [Naegleria fowleri]|uniref:Uncharacterized protein n=1 Tax=Naegleria fowleri TaxID=5763 RepID=A0A6A5CAU8_NAEFO|nr:uncharacterized protein FDP41_010759 [Naegleria fowleri]KAF0982780.1 hypothetical protein FDP41_010759 [Naegleria fowleri]CAG4717462.1 unnamed protein product [Naegleria fowleri]